MLTVPKVVERDAQPYMAITERVTIPFNEVVGRVFGELFDWLDAHGAIPAAAPFIKYNLIAMPEIGAATKTSWTSTQC